MDTIVDPLPCVMVRQPPSDVGFIGRQILSGVWAYPFELEETAKIVIDRSPSDRWLQWIPRKVYYKFPLEWV
jgi:hypothetical protein